MVETGEVMREREQLAQLAEERRLAMRTLEQEAAEERARLDAQAKAERIRQISLMEDQYACAPKPAPPAPWLLLAANQIYLYRNQHEVQTCEFKRCVADLICRNFETRCVLK